MLEGDLEGWVRETQQDLQPTADKMRIIEEQAGVPSREWSDTSRAMKLGTNPLLTISQARSGKWQNVCLGPIRCIKLAVSKPSEYEGLQIHSRMDLRSSQKSQSELSLGTQVCWWKPFTSSLNLGQSDIRLTTKLTLKVTRILGL